MAFTIIKRNQIVPMSGVTGLFYGGVGIGKTTMGSTAGNAILLSFEKGGLERADLFSDAVDIAQWNDLPLPNDPVYKPYDTIIVDTLAAAVSCCLHHISEGKRVNIKDYGELSRMFKTFCDNLNRLGKNVIFLAHAEKHEVPIVGKGQIDQMQPTGGEGKSKEYIYRIVHFIAYMQRNKELNGINVFFDAGDTAVTKDSFGLSEKFFKRGDDFFLKGIIQDIKEAHTAKQERKGQALKAKDNLLSGIALYIQEGNMTSDIATTLYRDSEALDPSLVKAAKGEIMRMYKEAGYILDTESKSFIVPALEQTPETETPETEPDDAQQNQTHE